MKSTATKQKAVTAGGGRRTALTFLARTAMAMTFACMVTAAGGPGGITPAHAQDPQLEAGKKMVEDLIARSRMLADADPADPATLAVINEMVDRYFDYDRIARFAAGNAWRGASDAQKTRYKETFRNVLIGQAAAYLGRVANLDYTPGEAGRKGDRFIIVTGMIHDRSGQLPDSNLNWRLITGAGKPPRIMDIEVENISMLLTLQQEFTSIINANGGDFDVLIDKLNEITIGPGGG